MGDQSYPDAGDLGGHLMTTVRDKMHSLMLETLEEEREFHDWLYEAVRPMYVPSSWVRGKRKIGDCSKGCQFLARWAGAHDPMGRGYDPYGNSETMTVHLHHLDYPSQLKVGDYITFGPWGDDHAATVLEAGSDPLLWSFGHQGAPNTYRLSWDRRERHYLLNPVPLPPLTPDQKLRAKTGYWAWLQWKLGEGAWHHKGKSNPKVRPHVPKRIPLKWWRRYVRLMLLRKRAANKATPTPTAPEEGVHDQQ